MILKPIINNIDAASAALKKLDSTKPPVSDRDAYHIWSVKIGNARQQLADAVANIIGFAP